MKKLKLNKQTISVLGNEGQKSIIGGANNLSAFPCGATGQVTCANYTVQTNCVNTRNKDCNSKVVSCSRAPHCA